MISVTCAVIRNEENEVLVVQRGEATDHPFKWEFPGGKLTSEETAEECIIREVEEELSIDIVICGRLPEVEYDYGIKQIKLIPFICDTLDELPLLSEHLAYKWLPATDLISVDFSEADVFVADNYLKNIKKEDFPELQSINEAAQTFIDDADLQSMVNNMMSMKEAEWVATSAIENPAIFLKLFEYSYSPDKKLAFRASWTLTKVCDKFPEIIYPYLSQMVDTLSKLDNESALRSFLRIISLSDVEKINNFQHGKLADFCFNVLKSGFTAIAVKAYSMEILYRLSLIYPGLANELSASIRILLEDGSAGITSRGRMILKKLAEIPINPKSNQL
ncbi:MAG: (deoxy)nucleoside triphosphate pyrophosphohydrolase [Bacteroidia bacterium]|nr:(deoxy)nucleoside triphosphate pyrophosphohydrolase [Bacteroidia bacterium]